MFTTPRLNEKKKNFSILLLAVATCCLSCFRYVHTSVLCIICPPFVPDGSLKITLVENKTLKTSVIIGTM